jgi:tetratricopeptide (TPR) repeat protein
MEKLESIYSNDILFNSTSFNYYDLNKDSQALFAQATALINQRDFDMALNILNNLIQQVTFSESLFFARAEIYKQQGKFQQAVTDYSRIIELNPLRIEAFINRGEVYRLNRQFHAALADLNRAFMLDRVSAMSLGRRGATSRKFKNYNQALLDFNRAIELAPQNTWLLGNRAEVYRNLKEYRLAVEDYDRVLELNPSLGWAYDRRANIFLWLNNLEAARKDYMYSWQLNPANLRNAWMALWTKISQEDHRPGLEVADWLEQIALSNPLQPAAYMCRGIVLWIRGNYEESLSELEKANVHKPGEPGIFFWKGMAYASLRQTIAAQANIERAIEAGIAPVLLKPLNCLGAENAEFYKRYLDNLPGPSEQSNLATGNSAVLTQEISIDPEMTQRIIKINLPPGRDEEESQPAQITQKFNIREVRAKQTSSLEQFQTIFQDTGEFFEPPLNPPVTKPSIPGPEVPLQSPPSYEIKPVTLIRNTEPLAETTKLTKNEYTALNTKKKKMVNLPIYKATRPLGRSSITNNVFFLLLSLVGLVMLGSWLGSGFSRSQSGNSLTANFATAVIVSPESGRRVVGPDSLPEPTTAIASVSPAQQTPVQASPVNGTRPDSTTPATLAPTTLPSLASFKTVNLEGHKGEVKEVSWSSDGRFYVTASNDKTLKVWDANTNQVITTLDDKARPNTDAVLTARWSNDNQFIIAGSADKFVRIYSVFPEESIAKSVVGAVLLEATDKVVPLAVAMAPDNSLVLYPGRNVVHSWDASKDTQGPDFPLNSPGADVTALAFNRDGKYLTIGLSNGEVQIWDVKGNKLKASITSNKATSNPVISLAWLAGDTQLVVGYKEALVISPVNISNNTITIAALSSLPVNIQINSVAASPDGKRLALGSQTGQVELWSLQDKKLISRFSTNLVPITGLHWNQLGQEISVAGGGDKPILNSYIVPAS